MNYQLLHGDVITHLCTLPSESVNCVVAGPPYWGLRDYRIAPSIWGRRAGCCLLLTIEVPGRRPG